MPKLTVSEVEKALHIANRSNAHFSGELAKAKKRLSEAQREFNESRLLWDRVLLAAQSVDDPEPQEQDLLRAMLDEAKHNGK